MFILSFCLGSFLPTVPDGAVKDPVFDLDAILAPPLQARTLRSREKDGIVTEEVMFHAEMDGKKNVDIFAFFSYPKGAKKLPATVLIDEVRFRPNDPKSGLEK